MKDNKTVATLTPTLAGADFDAIFTEVKHPYKLGLINAEQLRMFHLNVVANRFKYSELQAFIKRNMGQYVFSRAQLQDYIDRSDNFSVGFDASIQLQQSIAGNPNMLGEIMLYAFLEEKLGAPKILSKIEIELQASRYASHSDAIHLLLPDSSRPTASLVFGTSSIIGDLGDAVDAAFEKLDQIQANNAVECQLAESTMFTESYDLQVSAAIKNILIPSPSKAPVYDTAYGIFLAYSLGLDPTKYGNDEYRQLMEKKMDRDIHYYANYIAKKIHNYGLSTHSFYIYVLPLDDADEDKTLIMNAVLFPGGTR